MLACIRAIPLTQTDSETFYDEFTFFLPEVSLFQTNIAKGHCYTMSCVSPA